MDRTLPSRRSNLSLTLGVAALLLSASVLSGCAMGGSEDPDLQAIRSEARTRGGAAPSVPRAAYFPVEGRHWISNGPHPGHDNAWDVLGDAGTEIRAVADGIVTHVRNTGGRNCTSGYSCSNTNANYVVVEHNFEGVIARSLYLHLQNEPDGSSLRCLAPGDLVRQGQVIGRMGDTGYSSPANVVHLHFQFQAVCTSYWCDSLGVTRVSPRGFVDAGIPGAGYVTGAPISGAPAIAAACESTDGGAPTPGTGGGSVCASGPTLAGIDVSHWQGTIDWDRVAGDGVEFAFIRASDGLGYPDGEFARNWSEARRVGIVRGAYQFFRAEQDPIAQAELLISAMGELEADDLPPVLDVERLDGASASAAQSAIATWIAHVESRTGRTPIVYTGYYFYRDTLGNPELGRHPLWIAQYGPTCPTIPTPWYRWTFHQTSDSGRVDGIAGNVDTNLFNGDRAALYALAGGVAPPPAPPAPPAGTCPSGDGLYCGQSSRGQDSGHLYRCTGGSYALVEACASGCTVAAPGTADHCSAGSTPAPTSCPSGNGLYCGDSMLGQNSANLYRCTGGSYTLDQACTSGCTTASAGTADYCSAGSTPTSCPSGDGLYCGDPMLGQNSAHLYRCTGGSYALSRICSSGCTIAPPGSPDYCI